jgi:hypothetical protein
MNLRPALLAAAALATALGSCLALGRWGPGGDGGLLGIVSEVTRSEELDPHIEAARRRDEAKRDLAAEVVAGRMTLREAAGHFRRLDEADPGFFAHALGPPRDERFFCENVLSVAWVVLMDQERYAAAARWFAEAFTAHPYLLAGPSTRHRYQRRLYRCPGRLRPGPGRGRPRRGEPGRLPPAGPGLAAGRAGGAAAAGAGAGEGPGRRPRPAGLAVGQSLRRGAGGRTPWPGCPKPNGKPGSSCGRTSRTRWPEPWE